MKRYFWIFIIGFFIVFSSLFSRFSKITIQQLDDSGAVKITVNFFISVDQNDIDDKVRLISERPNTEVTKSVRFKDRKTLEIFAMEKGSSRGFNTQLHIGPVKTAIPGLYKNVRTKYRVSVPPMLTGLSPMVPSDGPIILEFSTPIEGKELHKKLIMDFNFDLKPDFVQYGDGKIFRDLSRWILIPKQALIPGGKYDIKLESDLSNLRGESKEILFHRFFKVADMPKVVSVNPEVNGDNVKLYQPIEVEFTEEMKEVEIKMKDMIGDISVEGKTAVFKPHTVFVPGKTYDVKISGKSAFGQGMKPYTFKFTAMEMDDDKWWVEVNLRPLQKVVVYRGDKVIKSMVASGGLEDEENKTPRGFFTLKDRGEYFWTERISEGGLYWVRITGNYLIHSVPRGKDNEIIEEEFKRLGIPASHGCIRLKDKYAKWFYDTIPSGTLMIIHD